MSKGGVGHLEADHRGAFRLSLNIDAQIFIKDPQKLLKLKEKEKWKAVKKLDFESAAILRYEIKLLMEQLDLKSEMTQK